MDYIEGGDEDAFSAYIKSLTTDKIQKGDKITLFWYDGDNRLTVPTILNGFNEKWLNTENGDFRLDRVKYIALGHIYDIGDDDE